MAIPNDISTPCLRCEDKCHGFKMHKWRFSCTECSCPADQHDITDNRYNICMEQMNLASHSQLAEFRTAGGFAKRMNYAWSPIGLNPENNDAFLKTVSEQFTSLMFTDKTDHRSRKYRIQIPIQDRSVVDLRHIYSDEEKTEANKFMQIRNQNAFGIASLDKMQTAEGQECQDCHNYIRFDEFCLRAKPHGVSRLAWHPECFKCGYCAEQLVDCIYFWHSDRPFCERHYAQILRPRCSTCDELIFSNEYTKAMEEDHHMDHFACKNCDKSLTGHRYIQKEELPYCIQCYEDVLANSCVQCNQKIGCDSKDLSFKDRHWHEKCFTCCSCNKTLVNQPFATRDEAIYCSDCFDEKYAARCDSCNQVFKAGMRKFEYKGKQWHENCFICTECQQPIGTKSFIPHQERVVCVPCYESKFAMRCVKCSDVIRRGGVTYKGESWHKSCFICTQCKKELAGIKFISKDEQPYCTDCYGELFSKKCCKCTKPITGIGGCKFISFEDRHWHSDCFNCYKCTVNLVGSGFLTSDDQILCPECGG